MLLSLFFVGLLGLCIGWNIDIAFDQAVEGNGKEFVFTVLIIILCAVSLWLNARTVTQGIKHPVIEVNEMPPIDTLTYIQGQDTTTTYLLDFTKVAEPVKHVK